MLPTLEDFARSLKAPQLQFIREIILAGLSEYADPQHYSAYARLVHTYTPSVRAQIRNSHIVYAAYRRAMEQPELGIQAVMRGNRRLFYINGVARLSFKKLDANLRHRNYPTRQALAFDAQLWPDNMVTRSVDGIAPQTLWSEAILPDMTNVVGGYLANAAETSFEIYVICPDGAGNAWEWPLTSADITELIAAEDAAKTNAAKKIAKRRLRLRNEQNKKQGTDDANK